MHHLRFRIAIVKPTKELVAGRTIKASDFAWRTAIFGMGGSRKRLGRARIGNVDGQPLCVVAEFPETVTDGTPTWTIETDVGFWAFAGPGAVHNDAGYGPATIGISIDRLKGIVSFNPDPAALAEGLERTLEQRNQAPA